MVDYYNILGVSKNASADEIKSAYRKKAKEYHPDKNSGEDSTEKFRLLVEAYEIIGDENKRKNYDNRGSDFFNVGEWVGGLDFEFGYADMYKSSPKIKTLRSADGSDIRIIIPLMMEEINVGAKKIVRFKRFIICDECSGRGTLKDYVDCPICKGTGDRKSVV